MMTVSQRAHNIRQIDPRISWADAMKQANKEIYLKQLEKDGYHAKVDPKKYPNLSVDRAIKDHLTYSYISETVFSSSGDHGFIAFTKYKDRSTGRISKDWFDAVKKIAETLKVDITTMPTYSDVAKHF